MRIILLICTLVSAVGAADKARIAVLPLQADGVSAKMAASVTELITSEAEAIGIYQALPPEAVTEKTASMKVDPSKLADLTAVGSRLQADLVVSGSLSKAPGGFTVALQFTDIINGKVIKAVKETRKGTEMDLYNVLGGLMIELFGEHPTLADLSYQYGLNKATGKDSWKPLLPAPEPGRGATLTFKNVPDQGVVLVNGRFGGLGGGTVTVEAGDVHLTVKAEHYETFDQIETVKPGEKKTIDANLFHTMAAFRVSTVPPGAAVLLNGKSVGATDLYLPHLEPGSYEMVLRLTDYKKIAQKITAQKNTDLKYAFTLERTPEYLLRQKKKKMMVRKIAFGSLAAVFAGAGMYMDGKVKDVNEQQDAVYEEYNNTEINIGGGGGDYQQFKEDWSALSADADKYLLLRTVMYILSAGSMAGMGVSFVF